MKSPRKLDLEKRLHQKALELYDLLLEHYPNEVPAPLAKKQLGIHPHHFRIILDIATHLYALYETEGRGKGTPSYLGLLHPGIFSSVERRSPHVHPENPNP